MKSYEQQCAERLEDINRTLKELTKAVHYISLNAKLTRDELVELRRQLEEAKEFDPLLEKPKRRASRMDNTSQNTENDYINKED